MKEDNWFEAAKNKEEWALTVFYKKYKEYLLFYISKRVNVMELAEDIHAESFENAFNNFYKFYSESAAKSYLFTIAKNKIIDNYKNKKFENNCGVDNQILFNKSNSPEKKLEQKELKSFLNDALMKLKPIELKIVEMYFFNNLKASEVSGRIGENKKFVENKVLRIKNKLKRYLNKYYKD